MNNNINDKLALFVEEGPIWDALNHLQDKRGSRYGAHCALIEFTQAVAVDTLDEVCDTGSAMYLAAQLVGKKVFQHTMASAIKRAIKLDMEDGDLTETDGVTLQKILKVSIA
jgi:hypothetical protein